MDILDSPCVRIPVHGPCRRAGIDRLETSNGQIESMERENSKGVVPF